MTAIPPGKYKLFCWDDIEEGAWQDGDFLRRFENEGREVSLMEGDRQRFELSTIVTTDKAQQTTSAFYLNNNQ
jgi:hypothetical protein